MTDSNTPIIVGVGQFTERLDSPEYMALSAIELAAEAARKACEDALSLEKLAGKIDAIVTTRTFEDSGPAPAPFGRSNNFPRSIAKRLNANPEIAIWETAGGQTPQMLVTELFEKISAGTIRMGLLVGAEAISTVRNLLAEKKVVDWSETIEGSVQNRGFGLKGLMTRYNIKHKIGAAPPGYGLFENARRSHLGLSRSDYAISMGRVFEPFTRVAAANPYSSAAQQECSAHELVTVTERNRMIAEPYTRMLVSRDQVNQAAAVVLTSVGAARELGIDERKWVYLHGYANLKSREIMNRPDLGSYPAAVLASQAAMQAAGVSVDDVEYFDFYSCFPVAVTSVACDGLGLSVHDRRGLTVTGGLPFFGGPGNNYSMHAIASMVEKLRASPGKFGFVGANGGFLSKYSVGIYSTRPAIWKSCDSKPLQAQIDALPAPEVVFEADGWANIETYTVVYQKNQPDHAIIVGRLTGSGKRFLANTHETDQETVQQMLAEDPLGRRIFVRSCDSGNRFAFSQERLAMLYPPKSKSFRETYEHCVVTRHGRLLEVTINRPEVGNCLNSTANQELSEIFDAYLADDQLWVAILAGAGTEAFCVGNDVKDTASVPKTGLAGLTGRPDRTKPVIAAVNGHAIGGGMEIALACDLVVVDREAQFAMNQVRLGRLAECGGIPRLTRHIPKKLATEMILTGRSVGAAEAKAIGLVNRVVDAGMALEGARALAAELLQASPTSVRLSLQISHETDGFTSEMAAARCQSSAFDELFTSEDLVEGAAALVEKRKPNWVNR